MFNTHSVSNDNLRLIIERMVRKDVDMTTMILTTRRITDWSLTKCKDYVEFIQREMKV